MNCGQILALSNLYYTGKALLSTKNALFEKMFSGYCMPFRPYQTI